MRKTALLLRTLEKQHKHVDYFALDVSRSSLRSSIRELLGLFPWNQKTRIQGLLGTYEDCISWLHSQSNQRSPVTLLWLGNSIANFTPGEAAELLTHFFRAGQSSSVSIQMIAGIDGCQRQAEIIESYESDKSRDFILNGLDCANSLLRTETFVADDWDFCGQWNVRKWAHESFCVARRDLTLQIDKERFHVKCGERVRVIRSGKWPHAKVADICAAANIGIAEAWSNSDGSYSAYSSIRLISYDSVMSMTQANTYLASRCLPDEELAKIALILPNESKRTVQEHPMSLLSNLGCKGFETSISKSYQSFFSILENPFGSISFCSMQRSIYRLSPISKLVNS